MSPNKSEQPALDDIGRLRFAVRFSEEELDHYREGDWTNLRQDLAAFIDWSRQSPPPAFALIVKGDARPTRVTSAIAKAEIEAIQVEVATTLRGLVIEKVPESSEHLVPRSTIPMIRVEAEWGASAGFVAAHVGSAREAVLLRLLYLLARHGHESIRPCPECGRLFWRVRRQLYCSRTCVNRVNMRAWTKAEKKKARTRSARKRGRR